MEQFDIYDVNGHITGKVANKGTVLEKGQYYLGVHAYIVNASGRFLIQQRAFSKSFLPGGWEILLGHAITGETSVECVIREIKEEIGLTVNREELNCVKRFIWEEYHHMVDIYFIEKAYEMSSLKLQQDEVIAVKEISADEMLELIRNMDYRPDEYKTFITEKILSIF